jgi:hypothetical protein
MATVAVAPPPKQKRFPADRAADANFFLLYVALIWLAVIAGFGGEMIRRLNNNAPPFPIAVHVHALITLSWLGLLTGQTLLVRKRQLRLHRRWGVLGIFLAVAVIAGGLWAAFAFERLAMGTPVFRPHFLAIEGSNIIEFGGLAAAAIIGRNRPAAHKRLILLATLSLTPAAFNRAIGKPFLHPLLGSGVWQTWIQIFSLTDLMVVGIGLYDWRTRGRIHPAWALGALWILTGQVIASWLFYNPTWKAFAGSILTWS